MATKEDEKQTEEVTGIGEGNTLLGNIQENLPGILNDDDSEGRDYSLQNLEKQEKDWQESQDKEKGQEEGGEEQEEEQEQSESKENQEEGGEEQEEQEEQEEGEEEDETQKQFREKVQKLAPNQKIENSQQAYETALEVMDSYENIQKEKEDLKKQYQEFTEAFEDDPAKAQFLEDVQNGYDLEEAAFMNLDTETLTNMEDEPDKETLQQRKKERKERLDQLKEQQKSIEGNQETTKNNIEAFAKEKELSNDQTADFIDQVKGFMDEYDQGLISKDFLNKLYTALNSKQNEKKAEEAGKIKARNEKINENLKKKKKSNKGDGMPHPKGNTRVQQTEEPERDAWSRDILNYEKRRQKL